MGLPEGERGQLVELVLARGSMSVCPILHPHIPDVRTSARR